MAEGVLSFYEALADHYHLIFDDWDAAIERQAKVLGPLLAAEVGDRSLKILDCACGIGTQALGFAALGHQVTASDLSGAAVDRARREAKRRALEIAFQVADMTSLREIVAEDFDVVTALDNALPHLNSVQLAEAAKAIAAKLRPGGFFLASIRDYDQLVSERPTMQPPAFYGEPGARRIVHQVWDWMDEVRYIVHLYIATEAKGEWVTRHFLSEYRCLLRDEFSAALHDVGLKEVRWLMPSESGFYQPLVLARAAV